MSIYPNDIFLLIVNSSNIMLSPDLDPSSRRSHRFDFDGISFSFTLSNVNRLWLNMDNSINFCSKLLGLKIDVLDQMNYGPNRPYSSNKNGLPASH